MIYEANTEQADLATSVPLARKVLRDDRGRIAQQFMFNDGSSIITFDVKKALAFTRRMQDNGVDITPFEGDWWHG